MTITVEHPESLPSFADSLIAWQQRCGRHHLPWQVADPYRVWLSEIMLQQTQVATVLNYYPRFVATFPTVADLAAAEQDAVLRVWQGLGYYSRARNLHRAAQQVMADFGGRFPQRRAELEQLCGVGRSTAAAIAAFAYGRREAILDGNVKRVLCRVFARDGDPQDKAFVDSLWQLAESLLPEEGAQMAAYTQGLMDLGATVCKRSRPDCDRCPMAGRCLALAQERVAQLPRRKTAAVVTVLPLYWLLLYREDGALWLVKRPQRGIWGGLWCVPCVDSLAAAQAGGTAAGVAVDEWDELPEIQHRLTHRLLQITPLRCRIRLPENRLPDAEGRWVLPAQWAEYGLPKPLARHLGV